MEKYVNYVAGTKMMRLTPIEEAVPFLKLGRRVAIGVTFPLTPGVMDKKLRLSAGKKTKDGNYQSDFFYMVR